MIVIEVTLYRCSACKTVVAEEAGPPYRPCLCGASPMFWEEVKVRDNG